MSQGRAVGETPAVAARVQEAAQPNAALITEATQRHVAGFFTWKSKRPVSLRGFLERLGYTAFWEARA